MTIDSSGAAAGWNCGRLKLAALLPQEKILVRQFNKGDIGALRQIYAQYKVDLTILATALLFDKALAEDVVHEVFARLLDTTRKIRINSSLRGYLLRAVANGARNVNRSDRRKDLDQDLCGADCFPLAESPEYSAIFKEQREKLVSALPELPYEQREVLLLRHFGGLRFQDIAKSQGVSVSTVQGRYRYGLEKRRSSMGGDL